MVTFCQKMQILGLSDLLIYAQTNECSKTKSVKILSSKITIQLSKITASFSRRDRSNDSSIKRTPKFKVNLLINSQYYFFNSSFASLSSSALNLDSIDSIRFLSAEWDLNIANRVFLSAMRLVKRLRSFSCSCRFIF